MPRKPLFIAIDGPDLTGKSTVAHLLLNRSQEPCHLYNNPGGTPLGHTIRKLVKDATIKMDPLTVFYLFAANHSDLAHIIKRKLDSGVTVIVDRWWPSTYTYQGLSGVSLHHVVDVIEQFEAIIKPDFMFYLRCTNEVAQQRAKNQSRENDVAKDRFEEKGWEFRQKLLELYDKLALMDHMIRIDTDDLAPGDVTNQIVMELSRGKTL